MLFKTFMVVTELANLIVVLIILAVTL